MGAILSKHARPRVDARRLKDRVRPPVGILFVDPETENVRTNVALTAMPPQMIQMRMVVRFHSGENISL